MCFSAANVSPLRRPAVVTNAEGKSEETSLFPNTSQAQKEAV